MKNRHIGFKKGRQISNLLYAVAGFFLVWRILFTESGSVMATVAMGLGVVFFCIGMVIYSKFCRCPKCGLMQPRYIRNRCEHCQTELD